MKIKQEFVDREERGGRITCSEDRVKTRDREADADQHCAPSEYSAPGVQFLVRNETIPTRQLTFRWSNRIGDFARFEFLSRAGSRD